MIKPLTETDRARLYVLAEARRRALEHVGDAEAQFEAKRRTLIDELESLERAHRGQRTRLIDRAERAHGELLAFATTVRGEYCDGEGDWELDVAGGAFVRIAEAEPSLEGVKP